MINEVKVMSDAKPKDGHMHRTSHDFSTNGLRGQHIKWICPDGVSFKVCKDDGDKHQIMFKGEVITNGTITKMIHEDYLYISRDTVLSQGFEVIVKGIEH